MQGGRLWLEHHAAGRPLRRGQADAGAAGTPDRVYYAVRELADEWNLDFCGIKGQPEMTNNWCTMDVAEAFLNDPYDWDGPKETLVCSTESDMDAALTMQIMKGLTGTPVLFADVRHYQAEFDVWDLCNSGEHATWFAARSDDPAENLAACTCTPKCCTSRPAAPRSSTRGAGRDDVRPADPQSGRYRMHLLRGEFSEFDDRHQRPAGPPVDVEWPHAFARFNASAEEFLTRFSANHIHAVPGDVHGRAAGGVRIPRHRRGHHRNHLINSFNKLPPKGGIRWRDAPQMIGSKRGDRALTFAQTDPAGQHRPGLGPEHLLSGHQPLDPDRAGQHLQLDPAAAGPPGVCCTVPQAEPVDQNQRAGWVASANVIWPWRAS